MFYLSIDPSSHLLYNRFPKFSCASYHKLLKPLFVYALALNKEVMLAGFNQQRYPEKFILPAAQPIIIFSSIGKRICRYRFNFIQIYFMLISFSIEHVVPLLTYINAVWVFTKVAK